MRRGTGAEIERENVRRLAEDLGPDEGMLIFPEGTRFTEERRLAMIAKIAERDPALAARAEQIHHLLPPKVGGVLAILEGAPDADILVVGHTGFDGLRRMSEIWDGVLVGREIRVRIRADPARGRAARRRRPRRVAVRHVARARRLDRRAARRAGARGAQACAGARRLRRPSRARGAIARSASAVIVRLGLTPGLAGTTEPSQISRFS